MVDLEFSSVKINLSIEWCLMKTGNCFFPIFNWKGNSKNMKAGLAETKQLYRGAQNNTSHLLRTHKYLGQQKLF